MHNEVGSTSKHKLSALLRKGCSYLILLLEAMNVGVVYPIVAFAFENPHASFFPISVTSFQRTFAYGLLVAAFMLGSFIATFFVAKRRTMYGQKKTLIIALITTSIGYLLAVHALYVHAFILLVIARAVAGLGVGAQPVLQEVLLDGRSGTSARSCFRNISLLTAAGVALGPLFGAIFADAQLSPYFHLATPMLVMGLVSLFMLLCVVFTFKSDARQLDGPGQHELKLASWFRDFFMHMRICFCQPLSLAFALFLFGWASFYFYIAWYADGVFDYGSFELSLYMACFSLGFLLGMIIFNALSMQGRSPRMFVINSFFAIVLISLFMLLIPVFIVAWVGVFLIGLLVAIACPSFFMLLMDDGRQQAQLPQYFYGQLMPCIFACSALFSGLIDHRHFTMPLWLGSIGLLGSALLLLHKNSLPVSR